MQKYNTAIVGVGAVGIEMLSCLKQRKFPLKELRLLARSDREIQVDGVDYKVEAISPEKFDNIKIALFAGTEGEKGASVLFAPEAVKRGAVVIDNGADFRMKEGVPLIIPEVNKDKIKGHKGIIANPNCTTIQMLVALNRIFKQFGLKQIILSSYQAVSGAGKKAAVSLWEQAEQVVEKNEGVDFDLIDKKVEPNPDIFPSQIIFNVIPKIGSLNEYGYTTEEWKTVKETHKIFEDSSIKITSTCVRVPVITSHSESVYFQVKDTACLKDIKSAIKDSEGVEYSEDAVLPVDAEGKDKVFVSRVREDPFNKNCFWLWCVSDNLRKGAALNAVQIAEELVSSGLLD